MANLRDKIALVAPAKAMARGIITNVVDFPESDVKSMQDQKAELLRLERTIYGWFVLAYADDTIMPPPPAESGLTKLDLIRLAAESTASALENITDALAVDVDTVKPETIAQNTLAWVTFMDHYRWMLSSLVDDTYWPPAPAGIGGGATAPVAPPPGPPMPGSVTPPELTGKRIVDLLVPVVGTPDGQPLIDKVKSVMMGG